MFLAVINIVIILYAAVINYNVANSGIKIRAAKIYFQEVSERDKEAYSFSIWNIERYIVLKDGVTNQTIMKSIV